jgi:DNA modification methylase
MLSLSAHVGLIEDGCPAIADESVDLAIYSPPYFKRHGYSPKLMLSVGKLLTRALKPGGRAYMVFGQILEDLERPLVAQRLVREASDGGLAPGQTIIWVKSIAAGGWTETCPNPECETEFTIPVLSHGHFQSITSDRVQNYCWEYVFCFIKEPQEVALPLDRLSIGVPYTDKANLKRDTRGKNGDVHCVGDVWFIPHPTTGPNKKKEHGHEFPEELARRLIKLSAIAPGSTVGDPFVGGGTTIRMAYEAGMNAAGYDKNKKAIAAVKAWWSEKPAAQLSA